MSSSPVPAFYYIFFTTIDPILALTGIITCIFFPEFMLKMYYPTPTLPPGPETLLLLNFLAGFFACVLLLQVVLLHARPADIRVWRIQEAAITLTDLGILWGSGKVMREEGRLKFGLWRLEEWTNLGIIAGVAALRIAFCLGVGMGREKGKRA